MKFIAVILFCLCCYISHSQPQRSDSLLSSNIDSLNVLVSRMIASADEMKAKDTTILKVAKLEEIFKKSESSWWEKWMPSVIALLTVLISSTIAYKVGAKNASVQAANAEKQSKTQLAVAADQLDISRQQIEQTARNTIEQVRANNLTQARLEWIKSIRPLLSELLPNIFQARVLIEQYQQKSEELKNLREESYLEFPRNERREVQIEKLELALETMEKEVVSLRFKIEEKRNQILLFLNPDFPTHVKLEESLNHFFNYISDIDEMNLRDIQEESDEIIKEARLVLSEAWNLADKEAKLKTKIEQLKEIQTG
ncbi:hypothetical protein HRG84_19205 [Flavisolibacter sp. BT320]|nr:hypothetical protein [Flavisolibacter longurius]